MSTATMTSNPRPVSSGVSTAVAGDVAGGLQGLDFALTALFVVLAIEAFRTTRDLGTAGLAVLCAAAYASATWPSSSRWAS